MKKEKLKKVNTIIWDCDNTIWIHRKDEIKIISKYFGIPNIPKLNEQFNEMLKQLYIFFEDRKVTFQDLASLIETYIPIVKQYGIKPEKFLEEWLRLDTSFLNEDALEVIKYFYAKGFKNIVLTDWLWDSQVMLLEKYGVLPYIEKVYTCDDEYLKTNPKTKERVIEKGKEKQYIIVGDTLISDIAFANMAGIQSVWFNPNYKENDTKYTPTYEVSSLLELCKIFK